MPGSSLGDAVELRVHGVHGTSPATMLGVSDSEVGQVAGDRLTGVYRAKDKVGLPYRSGRAGVSVEAYSWGALTSGVQGALGWVRRVLWLLLLPFALVNLAHWARIEVGSTTRHGRDVWGARAVRLTGLLLTVFFALSVSVVAIDLIGWQCYRRGVPGCALPGQLDFLSGLSPARRLAVTSVLPMLAVGVLWLLSRNTLSRYEDTPKPVGDDVPHVAAPLVLRHPHLWNGRQRTERLQRLHIAAALATVVAFTDLHLFSVTDGDPVLPLILVVLGLGVVIAAAGLTLASHPHDVEHDDSVPAWTERTGWLTLVALGLCVVHLVVLALRPRDGVAEGRDFVGHNLWFIVVFVLMTALALAVFTGGRMKQASSAVTTVVVFLGGAGTGAVLFARGKFDDPWIYGSALVASLVYIVALNVWHYRTSGHDHQAWRGASASTLLAAAAWVALLFTTSAVIAAADYANGSEHSIADVVSSVPVRPHVDPNAYVATGDVILRDAWVVTDPSGGPVRVVDGTIEVEELSLPATTDKTDKVREGYTVGLGSTRVGRDVTLATPKESVSFVDSCFSEDLPVRPDDVEGSYLPCDAESRDFRTGGTLAVPGKSLLVEPDDRDQGKVRDDDRIVLASQNPPQQPIVVPQVLIWLPIGQLVWVLAVAVTVFVVILVYRLRAGRRIHRWPDIDGGVIPDRDRPACQSKRRAAGLAHRAERFLDIIGVVTVPIAMTVIVLSMTGKAPWELWAPLRSVATAALLTTYAVSAGLVILGSQIRRSEGTRRAVGVVWDLTTFWPRAAHPLAPPCYAERVVPELITRVRWALEAPGTDRVVLSGHSQGSLIVVAAASRLTDAELKQLRIITYGSQIRALYGRVFPGVIGSEAIGYRPTDGPATLSSGFPDIPTRLTEGPGDPAAGSLRQRLEGAEGSWVNLFRRTDPLGWRVFSDRDSDLDVAVPEVPPMGAGDPGPVVMTHSGYPHSRAYREKVCGWVEEDVPDEPTGTSGLTNLPPV